MDMGVDDRKIRQGSSSPVLCLWPARLSRCHGARCQSISSADERRTEWAVRSLDNAERSFYLFDGSQSTTSQDQKPHSRETRPACRSLSLRKISKNFGAIQALTEVDLALEPGEVLGLMGDNGAGKSTLVKIIAGNFPPSSRRDPARTASRCTSTSRSMRAQKGIEIVYQDLALCDNLTAAANVFLGREIDAALRPVQASSTIARDVRSAPASCSRELKSETRPRDLVRRMSGGQRQAVAIARTRLSDAEIVLMDEPTAAIWVRQVAEVLDLIRRLRDQGIAVVLISHRMPDVFAVADRVVVLRRGRKVAEKPIKASRARRKSPA